MPELPREEVRVWRQHYACDACGERMRYTGISSLVGQPEVHEHRCVNFHFAELPKCYPLITYAALEAPRA